MKSLKSGDCLWEVCRRKLSRSKRRIAAVDTNKKLEQDHNRFVLSQEKYGIDVQKLVRDSYKKEHSRTLANNKLFHIYLAKFLPH